MDRDISVLNRMRNPIEIRVLEPRRLTCRDTLPRARFESDQSHTVIPSRTVLPLISTIGTASKTPTVHTSASAVLGTSQRPLCFLSTIAAPQTNDESQCQAGDATDGFDESPDRKSNASKPKRKSARATAQDRQLWRSNQARYRRKQLLHAKELKSVVERLRREVPMLETQHTQLVTSSKLTAWYAVIEYFRLFRRGVPSPQQAPPRATDSIPSSEERRQLEFLRSTMAKNVVVGGQEGVKVLIQQWRRYSTYFDDLQLHLRHVSQASEVVFTASATLCVTISETTIRRVFSHLDFAPTTDRQQVKMPTLRSNLRGRRLKLPYRVMFEWDEEIKQVARVDTMIDFFTPIFHAVGTIEDAAFVMENARINLDSSIGEPSN